MKCCKALNGGERYKLDLFGIAKNGSGNRPTGIHIESFPLSFFIGNTETGQLAIDAYLNEPFGLDVIQRAGADTAGGKNHDNDECTNP